MGVVRNLLIRAGADFSAMNRGLRQADQSLKDFNRRASKSTDDLNRSFRRSGESLSSTARGISKNTGGLSSTLSGKLRPALNEATKSLGGMTGEIPGLSAGLARLGTVGGVTGGIFVGLAAAIGLAVVGIAKASQPAVRFQADLGRLNMQLGASTKEFMAWARAQGLARSTAADMGATYAVLLSSFVTNNKELTDSTKQLVQATRVTASATGRSFEDVQERIRSGLLGNTEAIEDLGVFVNVAMIESTNAFKKFANGKHWEQLDFHVQQQIRLMAILEQVQNRYGNSLQANVMTKQNQLLEQWKDIKLNLSNAFLPIWDAVLPALNALASMLVDVTDKVARFMYWITGRNYDEAVNGTNKQTQATEKLGDAIEKTTKKAKLGLAAFDEINQLNWPDDDGSGSGSGSGGGAGGSSGGALTGGGAGNPPADFPNIFPPQFSEMVGQFWGDIKQQVQTKVQELRDLLIGEQGLFPVMVTGITGTFDRLRGQLTGDGGVIPGLVTAISGEFEQLRYGLVGEKGAMSGISSGITGEFENLRTGLVGEGGKVPLLTTGIIMAWSGLNTSLLGEGGSVPTTTSGIYQAWASLRDSLVESKGIVPYTTNVLYNKWDYLGQRLAQRVPEITSAIKQAWDDLRVSLVEAKGIVPYTVNVLFNKWDYLSDRLIGDKGVIPQLVASIRTTWNELMQSLPTVTGTALTQIGSKISSFATEAAGAFASVTASIQQMLSAMGAAQSMPAQPLQPPVMTKPVSTIPAQPLQPPVVTKPVTGGQPSIGGGIKIPGLEIPGISIGGGIISIPGIGVSPSPAPSPSPGGGSPGGGGDKDKDKKNSWGDWLKSLIPSGPSLPSLPKLPKFGRGAVVNSPTLAMFGEAGAEAVIPLERGDVFDRFAGAITTAIVTAQQAGGTGRPGQSGDIVLSIDGVAFARVTNAFAANENKRIGGSMITST